MTILIVACAAFIAGCLVWRDLFAPTAEDFYWSEYYERAVGVSRIAHERALSSLRRALAAGGECVLTCGEVKALLYPDYRPDLPGHYDVSAGLTRAAAEMGSDVAVDWIVGRDMWVITPKPGATS